MIHFYIAFRRGSIPTIMGCLIVFLCFCCIGCKEPSQPAEDVEADQSETDTQELNTNWEQAKSLMNRARDTGEEQLGNVQDIAGSAIGTVQQSSADAANETARLILELYESAKEKGETTAGSAKNWLMDDLKRVRGWSYKVIEFESLDAEDLESSLNQLGNEGWECFHVHTDSNGKSVMMFKRRPYSYARNIPVSDLLRIMPLLRSGGEVGGE